MSENLLFLWRFSFSASHFVDDLKTTISTASSVSDVTEIIKFRMHARAMHHFSSRTTSYEATSSMRKVPALGVHPQYWERATSSVAWGAFFTLLWFHQWFQNILPFFAFSWLRKMFELGEDVRTR